MFRSCQICEHPERDKLDAALRAGQQKQTIAATYAVSRDALSRHANRHLDAPSDTLSLEAEKWRRRADELWHCATASEDVRGQAQACANGLRSLQIVAKRAAEQEEKAAEAAPAEASAVLTLDTIDRLIAEADQRTDALAINSAKDARDHWAKFDPRETEAQRQESSRKALLYDDLFKLFERCHANAAMREAVLQFASAWIDPTRLNRREESLALVEQVLKRSPSPDLIQTVETSRDLESIQRDRRFTEAIDQARQKVAKDKDSD